MDVDIANGGAVGIGMRHIRTVAVLSHSQPHFIRSSVSIAFHDRGTQAAASAGVGAGAVARCDVDALVLRIHHPDRRCRGAAAEAEQYRQRRCNVQGRGAEALSNPSRNSGGSGMPMPLKLTVAGTNWAIPLGVVRNCTLAVMGPIWSGL